MPALETERLRLQPTMMSTLHVWGWPRLLHNAPFRTFAVTTKQTDATLLGQAGVRVLDHETQEGARVAVFCSFESTWAGRGFAPEVVSALAEVAGLSQPKVVRTETHVRGQRGGAQQVVKLMFLAEVAAAPRRKPQRTGGEHHLLKTLLL